MTDTTTPSDAAAPSAEDRQLAYDAAGPFLAAIHWTRQVAPTVERGLIGALPLLRERLSRAHPTPDDLAARDERVRAEALAEVEAAVEKIDATSRLGSIGTTGAQRMKGTTIRAIRALGTQPKETPNV